MTGMRKRSVVSITQFYKEALIVKANKISLRTKILCGIAGIVCIGTAVLFIANRPRADTQETITFHENEAMRTMDTPVTMAEYMLYTLDVKNSYDEAMGENFYSQTGTNAEGETEIYENIVKEEIAESVRMVKVLCAAAEPEYEITLSEDEENVLEQNADDYYDSLMENGVDPDFMTPEIVRKYIREEYLSQKVYAHLESIYGSSAQDTEAIDVGNDENQGTQEAENEEISDELAEEIAKLVETYDSGYSIKTNINWELMDAFAFTQTYTTEDIDNALNTMISGEEAE